MYTLTKNLVLKVLKVPPEPDDPMGDVESLKVFRASYNYFRYRFYVWLIKIVMGHAIEVGVAVGFFIWQYYHSFSSGSMRLMVIGGFLLIAVIYGSLSLFKTFVSYAVLRLDYEMRWYKVSDRSLRIREGVITVREMTMTFANIQNLSITQGPIERLFGISDLKVESAGGGSPVPGQPENISFASNMHIAFFRGVDNAEEISALMKERLRLLKDSGLGDHDDVSHEQAVEPVSAVVPTGDDEVLSLLTAIRDEARAYRQAVQEYATN